MLVTLLQFTPEPELLMAAAARLCYRDVSASELVERLERSEVERLLDVVLSSGHLSVAEHIVFTFGIDGVSRVLTHQLVRHRVGTAFSQQSQRYTSVANAEYVTPPAIAAHKELAEEYAALLEAASKFYEKCGQEGVPKEDARFALPQAVQTRLVFTVNLRELIHLYAYDACLRSQWELRQLAVRMRAAVREVSPRLAQELRIKCFQHGYCEEAHMCEELSGKMPRKADWMRGGMRPVDYVSLEQSIVDAHG